MINNVMSVISDKINETLNNRFSQTRGLVIPTSLHEIEDESNTDLHNKLLLTIANIEQERLSSRHNPRGYNKPINLYLHLLLSSNFEQSNYEEGLQILSAAISFFQYTAIFNHENTPNLASNVDKLVFEMINLNVQELSQLWGVHGGKYLPSVLYRVRMVTIMEETMEQPINLTGFGAGMS